MGTLPWHSVYAPLMCVAMVLSRNADSRHLWGWLQSAAAACLCAAAAVQWPCGALALQPDSMAPHACLGNKSFVEVGRAAEAGRAKLCSFSRSLALAARCLASMSSRRACVSGVEASGTKEHSNDQASDCWKPLALTRMRPHPLSAAQAGLRLPLCCSGRPAAASTALCAPANSLSSEPKSQPLQPPPLQELTKSAQQREKSCQPLSTLPLPTTVPHSRISRGTLVA